MLERVLSCKSDINLRSENQDVFGNFSTSYGHLYLVADGMGGANAGYKAAHITVSTFAKLLDEAFKQNKDAREGLHYATREVNRTVFELGTKGPLEFSGMGTTLVLGLETDAGFLIGHIGDSRAYLIRNNSLSALTKDHTPIRDLVEQGIITEEAAFRHPYRSLLLQAIGAQEEVKLELLEKPIRLAAGEGLLFCSDGLTGVVPHKELQRQIFLIKDKQNMAEALIHLAKQFNSRDNITVLYLHEHDSKKKDSMWGRMQQGVRRKIGW